MPTRHERKLTIREAADYTGFSTQQITRAAKRKPTPALKAYWLGPYGPLAFTRSDLDSWLASMVNIPEQAEAEETPTPRPSRRRARVSGGAR